MILISNSVYSQKTEELHFDKQIFYNYKYAIDSNNRDDVQEEPMMLLLNDTLSLFASQKRLQIDSGAYENHKKGKAWAWGTVVLVHTGVVWSTNYQIFKSRNGIRTIDAINGKGITGNKVAHQYDELPGDFDWEILPDTMRISPYLCQKAKVEHGGRVWYAWFCPEIPLSDGPYTFSGLPGLIFQIHDRDNYFQFDLVQIQNKDRSIWVNMRPDLIIEKIDKKEFFRNRRTYQDNTFEIGGFRASNEQARKSSREIVIRNNNWIEKY